MTQTASGHDRSRALAARLVASTIALAAGISAVVLAIVLVYTVFSG